MNDKTNWKDEVLRMSAGIRRRVMEHTIKNNGGYLSQACSSADILATLYGKIMNLGESTAPMIPPPFPGVPSSKNDKYFSGYRYNGPESPEFDRFYLSPAHYALVLYAALIEAGRMAPEGLDQFNSDGSTVEMIGAEHSPGFGMMGGSLAQTLSQAAGIAQVKKIRGESGKVWVFMSDGEFQEGQSWEALQTLNHYKLDNIGVFIDINGQQCDGETCKVMCIDPLEERLASFGAYTVTVDAHNADQLYAASKSDTGGKPLFVLCMSNPCHEITILEKRRPKLHYVRFTSEEEREEYRRFLKENMGGE